MMALNPQITKQYASNDIESSMKLVYAGSRYSFFLLAFIAIPVMINLDYLLKLWLGTVPKYTSEFLFLALVVALINSMAQPLVTALQATGKIKVFQISICIIMLCELPLAYIILYFGGKPYMAMYPTLLVVFVGLFARFVILKRQVSAYKLRYFTFSIVGKNILLGIICFVTAYYMHKAFPINFGTFVFTSFMACLIVASVIYTLGITRNEKAIVINKLKLIFAKLK